MESICAALWSDERFFKKVIIGGIIGSIPLVNILALGYFFRFAGRLREGKRVELPEWDQFEGLFVDGIKMTLLKLVYVGIPTLIGGLFTYVCYQLFSAIRLDLLAATVSFLPLCLGMFIGVILWMVALNQYLASGAAGVLLNWEVTLRKGIRVFPHVWLGSLAFWGLIALGWPLLGFAFFLGFGPYVAYFTATLLSLKKETL